MLTSQLHMYGFERGDGGFTFSHPKFNRCQKTACLSMTRTRQTRLFVTKKRQNISRGNPHYFKPICTGSSHSTDHESKSLPLANPNVPSQIGTSTSEYELHADWQRLFAQDQQYRDATTSVNFQPSGGASESVLSAKQNGMSEGTIDSLLPSTQSGVNLRLIYDRLDVEPRNVLRDRQDVLFRPIGDVFEF